MQPYFLVKRMDRKTGIVKEIRTRGNRHTIGDRWVDLFRIGCVAKVMGMSSQTIRILEKDGVFPKALFSVPNTKPAPVNGKYYNERLYSRGQLELIESLLNKHKLLDQRSIRGEVRVKFFKELRERFYECEDCDVQN